MTVKLTGLMRHPNLPSRDALFYTLAPALHWRMLSSSFFLRRVLQHAPLVRRVAYLHTQSSTIELLSHPENFKGILSKYGWVLVKNTHVARGWTQTEVNSYLDQHLTPQQLRDKQHLQAVVDQWMQGADLGAKPKHKKKTAEDVRKLEELKLYLQQLKEEGKFSGTRATKALALLKRKVSSLQVTFTYAWNYYMAVTYPKCKDLPPKEARKLVAAQWRLMSMDQKDVYRMEYSKLLEEGKDILHGEIVDREVKMKQTARLQRSKKRSLRRKADALKALEQRMHDSIQAKTTDAHGADHSD